MYSILYGARRPAACHAHIPECTTATGCERCGFLRTEERAGIDSLVCVLHTVFKPPTPCHYKTRHGVHNFRGRIITTISGAHIAADAIAGVSWLQVSCILEGREIFETAYAVVYFVRGGKGGARYTPPTPTIINVMLTSPVITSHRLPVTRMMCQQVEAPVPVPPYLEV